MPQPVIVVARSIPQDAEVVGLAVGPSGPVPRQLGLNRSALQANGFDGKPGETLVVPMRDTPTFVAVGVGDDPSADDLRTAAAAFVRAAGERSRLATNLADRPGVDARRAQAVTEGVMLASYRYDKIGADEPGDPALGTITLVAGSKQAKVVDQGVATGVATGRAVRLARDLANTPPSHLTARDLAARSAVLASDHGLDIEVFDADRLAVLGCGGLLGVNAGSTEPPRMIKLTYSPRSPKAHVALVGKGVMYDSGGISLKPTNPMHAQMKMDMSGAAAVLSTMTALRDVGCRNKVTAWLMCTDNMPSGSALKLGDVLTIRNGKTVEIHNTDAEGRLVLADGLSLAAEESPDAIVDIATLTGAALAALGPELGAVLGNDEGVVRGVEAAAEATDEPIWELPLATGRYRKLLDSTVADMRNVGGPYAGAITAAIFLSEFAGDVPWAHIDMAGTMNSDTDSGWKSKGATGYGTRLLIEFATTFTSG